MSSKKPSKKLKFNLVLLSFLTFLFGMVYLIAGLYSKYQNLKLANSYIENSKIINDTYSNPTNIKIDSLGIDLPIDTFVIKDGLWMVSPNNASFLATSAKPGQGGNIIVYGHNKKNIFGKLLGRNLIGDNIEITTESGEKYNYLVDKVKIVSPTELSIVDRTDFEVLTIFTCTGILDSKRLVIKAYPSEALDNISLQ